MRKEEIVKNGYNIIAKNYHKNRKSYTTSQELKKFINLLSMHSKILDVGCGSGVPVDKTLIENGFKVTGIDISDEMLKLAKKNVPNADFYKMDMTKLDLKVQFFDGLIGIFSIIHIPRERHATMFKEFHRVLKPNGIMLVSLGSEDWEGINNNYMGAKMFWSHYGPKKTREFIKKANFKIIEDWYNEFIGFNGKEKHYWVLAEKL